MLWAQLFFLPRFEFSVFKTVYTFSFTDRKSIIQTKNRLQNAYCWDSICPPYWPWAKLWQTLIVWHYLMVVELSLWQFTALWIIRTRRKCDFVILQLNSCYERWCWLIFCAQNGGKCYLWAALWLFKILNRRLPHVPVLKLYCKKEVCLFLFWK